VPDEHVAAVLPLVSEPVRAMIELQSACGARPGEILRMRPRDIDRSGDVWVYRPSRHKAQGLGHRREIHLGPKAQEILQPWLDGDPESFVFSPAAAVALRNARKRRERKSPMTPSQAARRSKADPKRAPRARYDGRTYRQAVARACAKAGIPPWHPH